MQPRNPSSIYFGKISSRGDFVRSASGTKLISLMDNWVAQGMELLIATPDWKTCYDRCGPIDFLLLGTRKKHAVCGSMVASADTSSRRFPFIAATLFEIDESLAFVPYSPLMVERHVNHQRALIELASSAVDAADTLAALNNVTLEAEPAWSKCNDSYRQFVTHTTLAGLAETLMLDGGYATMRQIALAIGYLLQPVPTNYAVAPQKGLALPLPKDPSRQPLVKSLWLDLICTFLPRADFELSIFSRIRHDQPKLIVTFNGTTPALFRALFGGNAEQDLLIDIAQSEWVEDYAAQDAATFKLSSYLEHGELSLHQLIETFRQGFSG